MHRRIGVRDADCAVVQAHLGGLYEKEKSRWERYESQNQLFISDIKEYERRKQRIVSIKTAYEKLFGVSLTAFEGSMKRYQGYLRKKLYRYFEPKIRLYRDLIEERGLFIPDWVEVLQVITCAVSDKINMGMLSTNEKYEAYYRVVNKYLAQSLKELGITCTMEIQRAKSVVYRDDRENGFILYMDNLENAFTDFHA